MQAYAERSGDFMHGSENTEPGTGHWNGAGHRLAGRVIAEDLCQSWPDLADPSGHRLAASDGSPKDRGMPARLKSVGSIGETG